MELASQSRIELSGCKLEGFNGQRVKINQLGFNSRYKIILEGVYSHLLSKAAFEEIISIKLYQNTGPIYLHGELLSITQQYIKPNKWTWQIEIGCSLHRLDNESGHHLFIDNTVEEIIKELFDESGISCQFNITGSLSKLPYTAQGGVSDYDFLMRLCIEHGLVFYYRFDVSGWQLHLTDSINASQTHTLNYNPDNGLNDSQPVINSWSSQQANLADHVRLRAYNEEDFTTLWESITSNQTKIPGSGIINLTESHSLNSQSECDERARLLQQQLDWQRETFHIQTTATNLQPGDCVRILNTERNDSYMVFDVRASIDESPIKGEPHPFQQNAYLLPLNTPYKTPCRETMLSRRGKEESYIPQAWVTNYEAPQPSLQIALIAGGKDNKVAIDDQGRYKIKPLFDAKTRAQGRSSHYLRQAQPGAGLPKNQAQGTHLPLASNTRVIIGHLDSQIDKPFILGVHPESEQLPPANHYNLDMLSLKHRNGSGLEFKETSLNDQSINLFTEENQHGLKLQASQDEQVIQAKSKGEMLFQSKKDSHINSKQANLHNDNFLFKAEEDYSLVAKEKINIESGGNQTFTTGQNWQSLTKSGELNSQAEEKFNIEGKNISIKTQQLHSKTSKTNIHAGKSLTFDANESLCLQSGQSTALFSNNDIGFKAPKITINASTIQMHQGGMVNSGTAPMPEQKQITTETHDKQQTKSSSPQQAKTTKQEPATAPKNEHHLPDKNNAKLQPKKLSNKRLQDKEGYLLSEADKATIHEAQKKIEQLKLTKIDDGQNPNLLHIAVVFDGTWNDRLKMEYITNPAVLRKLFDNNKTMEIIYKKGVGTDPETKLIGGAIGLGTFPRVSEAFDELSETINHIKKNKPKAEIVLSIVGFSRGATEARHFVNAIVDYGIPDLTSKVNHSYTRLLCQPRIGDMVLFDTVAALGLPGTSVTMGFKLGIPPQVENVLHITANDEHRGFFPLHSVIDDAMPNDPRIIEIGLPGAHSDIGGGYHNAYSKIPLNMAYDYLKKLGVPLNNLSEYKAPSVDNPELRLHDSRYLSDKLMGNTKQILGLSDHRQIYHVHNH